MHPITVNGQMAASRYKAEKSGGSNIEDLLTTRRHQKPASPETHVPQTSPPQSMALSAGTDMSTPATKGDIHLLIQELKKDISPIRSDFAKALSDMNHAVQKEESGLEEVEKNTH